jgi:hypothetical protein
MPIVTDGIAFLVGDWNYSGDQGQGCCHEESSGEEDCCCCNKGVFNDKEGGCLFMIRYGDEDSC